MPSIASPSTWRNLPYKWTGYLYIHKPDTIYSARVNQTTFNYPMPQITYDTGSGTLANVKTGMLITFGSSAGADDYGRTYIRKTPTSDTFYIGYCSYGAADNAIRPSDDAYITVYDAYIPFIKPNRYGTNTEEFKDYELDFATYGVLPPTANPGADYAQLVDGSDEITVNFTGSGIGGDNNIASYAWTFPGGTPSSSASQSPTGVVFGPGYRWIELEVTDTAAETHVGKRLVVGATQGGAYDPVKANASNETITQDEHRISFEIFGDASDYLIGMPVIYWEDEKFGASDGAISWDSDRNHIKFIGYVVSIKTKTKGTEKGVLKYTEIICENASARLKRMSTDGHNMAYRGTPAKWGQTTAPNLAYLILYVLHFHTTIADVASIQSVPNDIATYTYPHYETTPGSIYSQLDNLARAIQYRLTCDNRNGLYLQPDPMHLDSGGGGTPVSRTSTVIMSLDQGDYTEIDVEEKLTSVYKVEGDAQVARNDVTQKLLCVAPGYSPSHGESGAQSTRRIVTNQTELNTQTGHMFARMNSRYMPVNLILRYEGDANWVPGFMEWVQLDYTNNDRGISWSSERFLLLEARIDRNSEQRTKLVSLQLEHETFGVLAATVNLPAEGETGPDVPDTPDFDTPGPFTGLPTPSGPIDPEDDYTDILFPPGYDEDDPLPPNPFIPAPGNPPGGGNVGPALPTGGQTYAYWTEDTLRLSKNLFDFSPTWADITPDLSAEDAGTNPVIQFFTWSGFGTDGYLITYDDTDETTRVYYAGDLSKSEPAWTIKSTQNGQYDRIETTGTRGNIYLYAGNGEIENVIYSDDFTGSAGAKTTITTGTYDGTGGHDAPGQARGASSGSPGNYHGTVVVQIDLDSPYPDVETVSFWANQNDNNNGTIAVQYYDSGLSLIDTENATLQPQGTYVKYTITSPQTGVRRIIITLVSGQRLTAPAYSYLDDLVIAGDESGEAVTIYSTDSGATFGDAEGIGATGTGTGGIDVYPISSLVLAIGEQYAQKATGGGAYAQYGSTQTPQDPPVAVFIPRAAFGKESTDEDPNNDSTNPEFLYLSSAGDGIWTVTDDGDTFTAITPNDGANDGMGITQDEIWMAYRSGKKIVGIFTFGGSRKLATSIDTGSNWTISDARDSSAAFMRMIKANSDLIYWIESDKIHYSKDFGTVIQKRTTPDTSILGGQPYG